jgi:manganese transport system permease protein
MGTFLHVEASAGGMIVCCQTALFTLICLFAPAQRTRPHALRRRSLVSDRTSARTGPPVT